MGKHTLKLGDCREIMQTLGDCSVDAMVTDPPAGISFMSKGWDSNKGGRDEWISWLESIMLEGLRVLKPGGHAVVWALPRTSHWTATAIENAGFEIRDVIDHIFGSGFPKSLDVGKAIDKEAGVEREVVGREDGRGRYDGSKRVERVKFTGVWNGGEIGGNTAHSVTAPATPDAEKWDGWGTALKPAHENWIIARKPLEGTVANNVKKHGTGGLNIAACRVGDEKITIRGDGNVWVAAGREGKPAEQFERTGRWPSNLILSHPPECNKECIEGCPVKELDRQSGEGQSSGVINRWTDGAKPFGGGAGHPYESVKGVADSGGASRFFPCFRYQAKAGRVERDAGCESLPLKSGGELTDRVDGSAGLDSPRAGAGRTSGGRCSHPTVKPVDLMRWLVRLVCPKDGTILDPFMGSGTTGIAAHKESCQFIGIEKDPDYFKIAEARIAEATKQGRLF